MEKPVAIILPCHNSGEHLKPALDAIIVNTEYPYKLIIIESESTDGSDKLVDRYAEKYEHVIARHTKKEGLINAINYGLDVADEFGGLDCYLTQDDCILPNLYGRDWLETLVKISKLQDCGLVSTLAGGGISGPDYIEGFNWFGTWSLFIPRSTIEKVGKFDENYNPGCGDDIDYSYRVVKNRLKMYVADFWVDHHRQTEHFNEDEQIKKEHAKYFRKKFGIKCDNTS